MHANQDDLADLILEKVDFGTDCFFVYRLIRLSVKIWRSDVMSLLHMSDTQLFFIFCM